MIKSIELMNWKSHLASKLEFSTGVNGLVGIMGSGKSSVTDAICFGLFGTFPKLQQRKIKLEDIVMKKPVDSKRSEIIVEFDSNGKTYKVRRVIDTDKRGGSIAEIMEDGKIIDANPKHVTEMVEQILKTDYELFSRAVYSEQNQLDYFLTVPKSERKKKIDELIRINKFETARAGANTVSNRLGNLKDSKKVIIESLSGMADEKKMPEMEDEIKNFEKSVSEMTAEAEFLETARIPKLYDLILEAEECKKNHERMLSESKSNNAAIEKTMEHLEKVKSKILGKDADDIRKEISAIAKEIEGLGGMLERDREGAKSAAKIVIECEAKINSMNNYALDADSRIRQKEIYEKELREIESGFSDIEKILDDRKNEYENKIEASKSLQAKIGEIRESVEKIKNIGDKCPVCDSDISEERKNKIISDRAARLEELQESFDACKSSMEKMKSELSEIERFWRRSITLGEGVKDLENLRKDLRESRELIETLGKTGGEEKAN
ncbi:MAG: SMC family ATPase, partial [Candidatus Aenigmatarchaeota archaeon]